MKRGRQSDNRGKLNSPVTIWGLHPVEECLRVRPSACEKVLFLPSFGRKRGQVLLKRLLIETGVSSSEVSDFRGLSLPEQAVHQGVVATVKPFWMVELGFLVNLALKGGNPVVVCDQISDPQNLGAIIRASAALGAAGVVISKRHGSGITGTVVKASAGAVFHAQVAFVSSIPGVLKRMKQAGLWIFGLDSKAEADIFQADLSSIPLALVAGSEQRGLRKTVRKELDFRVRIPMVPGVESLNVSSAVSIALYECKRQKAGVSN